MPISQSSEGSREPHILELTGEELALLRASVVFHARAVTDPSLRTRLEQAARKLGVADTSRQAA